MFKKDLGLILLFVDNPMKSADFYSEILELKPVEISATFAMFILNNGIKLGLWSKHTAEPKVEYLAGAMEICFLSDDVDKSFELLIKKKITVIQKPTDMDFGRTFVFLDPDCHRIRIYKLNQNQ